MRQQLSRRVFMERLCGGALSAAAVPQLLNGRAGAQSGRSQRGNPGPSETPATTGAWTPPPVITNPNILVIMVDQLRWPCWLNTSQMNTLAEQFLPNIFGRIRNSSYDFQQYYTAATICTASRGTLLTGLYAPQTATYISEQITATVPALNTAFPTWGSAVAELNSAYENDATATGNNCWWFGKWHLSNSRNSTPLQPYGFNTRTYPGGPNHFPSPDGFPNEGTDGGEADGTVYASDAEITSDFLAWLSFSPAAPWCATVSLINPHDVGYAPCALETDPNPPMPGAINFPPPANIPPAGGPTLLTAPPSPWNYEDLAETPNKPSLQYAFQNSMNNSLGPVSDWTLFLNQYYWLQQAVDQQVGRILDNLGSQAAKTIIVFTADHGEYGGSHGLHDKGYAAYDESLHVPLFVKFPGLPGQTSCIPMHQMCSSVDFFGLICDLATSGGGYWKYGPKAYPDLANRQSIWNFLYEKNATETRIAPTLGIPYILHTSDVTQQAGGVTKTHIVCLRTKANASNTAQPGAKLAIYSEWASCSTIPDGTPPDYEFYDYNPATTNNTAEMGNDYYPSTTQTPTQVQITQTTINQYLNALGSWEPAMGLIGSELNAPLIGNGLSPAQEAAQQSYFNYVFGVNACQI